MLYHFTSCEATLKILLTNELRFSKSINLDDPFERQRSRNYFYSLYPPIYPNPEAVYYEYYNYLVGYTNILCFFDSEDERKEIEKPLDDLKMWSHYGKNHTGCCLVFDKKKTITFFTNNINDSIAHYGKVEYGSLKTYESKYIEEFDPQEYAGIVFKKLFYNLFFNKAVHYSIENEYRFAVSNSSGFSLNVLSLINKVVIAENAKEIDASSIVKLCQMVNIEVGRMHVTNDRLEYSRIDAS